MAISIWNYESQLYPLIDATGVSGLSEVKRQFVLGDGHKVEVKIWTFDKTPLSLHQQMDSKNIGFRINFWSGSPCWLRFDNDHNFLHCHLASGAQSFDHQEKLPEQISISGLVSMTFSKAEEVLKWKFPQIQLVSGSGFVGFMGPAPSS